jgi:hypothetical protein
VLQIHFSSHLEAGQSWLWIIFKARSRLNSSSLKTARTDLTVLLYNVSKRIICFTMLKSFHRISGHHGLMVRRCFPVAKIVGSSPTGVVFARSMIFLLL